jgi:hypothetical protein
MITPALEKFGIRRTVYGVARARHLHDRRPGDEAILNREAQPP